MPSSQRTLPPTSAASLYALDVLLGRLCCLARSYGATSAQVSESCLELLDFYLASAATPAVCRALAAHVATARPGGLILHTN